VYSEFTALKSQRVETWIAVGGFDFSDPNTTTHYTWSQLVSSSSNRAAFISSLLDFLPQYGFEGESSATEAFRVGY
jgi:chitinase